MTVFSYANIIKTPAEMKSGAKSQQLGANITALKGYSSLLLTSDSAANSLQGHALGNQTWVPTNAYCVDDTGIKQKRYIYIDNQPSTNTPPNKNAQSGMEFNGLIPGMIDDIFKIDPLKLFTAFAEDGMPKCEQISLSVTDTMSVDKDGNQLETHKPNYITLDDLKNVNPCSFTDGKNSITGKTCPFKVAGDSFKEELLNVPSRTGPYCRRKGNKNNTGCINGIPTKARYVSCDYYNKYLKNDSSYKGPCVNVPKNTEVFYGHKHKKFQSVYHNITKVSDGTLTGVKVPQNNFTKTEAFSNISSLPKDKAVHLYFTTLSIVALYILYCFIKKTSR